MKEHKRRSGLWQLGIAFLILYATVLLLPAGVYGAAVARGSVEENRSQVLKDESESAPEGSDAPREFLEHFLPPEEPDRASEEFTVYDSAADKTSLLSADELLPAAIACEMDPSSPAEALKAQAVACYTLFCRKRDAGETINCDSQQWQTWTTPELMRERWGDDYETYAAILQETADSVQGQTLTFEGKPILAAYFAISAGSTEACENVWEEELPYLQAAASPGDMLCDGYLSTVHLSREEFRSAAASLSGENAPDLSGPPESWLTDLEYTASGYVRSGVLGGKTVKGAELRSAFSLRSAAFEVISDDGGFTFTVRGWGHGVGMSQAGAVFLAKQGAGYREILSRYYPGAVLTGPV